MAKEYRTEAARNVARSGYGGPGYADYIERHTLEMVAYYRSRGNDWRANELMARSIGAALIGNDGD